MRRITHKSGDKSASGRGHGHVMGRQYMTFQEKPGQVPGSLTNRAGALLNRWPHLT